MEFGFYRGPTCIAAVLRSVLDYNAKMMGGEIQHGGRIDWATLRGCCRFPLALTQSKPRQRALPGNDYPISPGETVRLIFHFRRLPRLQFRVLLRSLCEIIRLQGRRWAGKWMR